MIHIRKMVEAAPLQAGTDQDKTRGMQLIVDKVFALNTAGADAKFRPFQRLPNRMLLWKGARESSMASLLSQGLHVPTAEAPSASYPFGKGIYLQDTAAVAAEHCHMSVDGSGLLLLCEVALGNSKEETRPGCLRKAPHTFHSLTGRGRWSYDPADLVDMKLTPSDVDVKGVIGLPQASHGKAESCVPFNQYIVFDSNQLRPRFLVQVKRMPA